MSFVFYRQLLCGILGAFFVSGINSPAYASGGDRFDVAELAPGAYLHRGHDADIDDPERADSANIGFIVGARCVAVIDTGGALATGRALAAAIAATTPKPVCYVINTHVHFDHVLGNGAFVADGTGFVGHAALADAIAANRDFFAEHFADELGGPGQQARVIGPDTLVADELELDLGARVLQLRAVAAAHSTTDLTVFDVTTNSLWTGDLLFRERLPVLDGRLLGWLTWLDQVEAVHYDRVVPGHGPVDTQWPAGARALRQYLEAVRDDTRAAIAAGVFLEDAKRSVAAEARKGWRLTGRAHGLNVSRAYRELEWE